MDVLEKLCLDIRRSKSKPVVVVTWYRLPDANIGIFSHFEPRKSGQRHTPISKHRHVMHARVISCRVGGLLGTL